MQFKHTARQCPTSSKHHMNILLKSPAIPEKPTIVVFFSNQLFRQTEWLTVLCAIASEKERKKMEKKKRAREREIKTIIGSFQKQSF